MRKLITTVLQFISLLILFAIILAAAYYVTKLVGTKTLKNYKGKNIKVLEGIMLSKDNYLYLVNVGDKYLLLGCSSNHISCLKEMDKDNINLLLYETEQQLEVPFENYLSKIIHKIKKEDIDDNIIENYVENESLNDNVEEGFDFKSKLNNISKKRKDL